MAMNVADAHSGKVSVPGGELVYDVLGHGTPLVLIHAAIADRALTAFMRERAKGVRPIASGRQLQELMMTNLVFVDVLGVESLSTASALVFEDEEAVDAAR